MQWKEKFSIAAYAPIVFTKQTKIANKRILKWKPYDAMQKGTLFFYYKKLLILHLLKIVYNTFVFNDLDLYLLYYCTFIHIK